MTRTIDANLLAAQKKTVITPSLSLTIQDNNLAHPTAVIAHPMTGYSGNPATACVAGAAIVRAHKVAGVGIQVQRITNPATLSQWTSGWTTVRAGASFPLLLYSNGYVVLIYQDDATRTVYYMRSADDGQTWSAETSIWTPADYMNNVWCVASGGNARAALFYAESGYTTLRCRLYTASADSWWLSGATHNYGQVVNSIGACRNSTADDFKLVVSVQSYTTYATASVCTQKFYISGTWTFSTPVAILHCHGTDPTAPAYGIPYVNVEKLGDWYWFTYRMTTNTGAGAIFSAGDSYISFSDDAIYYTAGAKLSQPSVADRFQPLAWTDGTVYLASDTALMKSNAISSVTAGTDDIIAYDLHDEGPTAYLELTLDNRDGTYDSLATGRLGADLLFERGALIAGTAYRVAREYFCVSRVQRSKDGKRMQVSAYNYYHLLELWRAHQHYTFSDMDLYQVVTALLALAGIHSASFDASTFWNNKITEFTIQPGQSALEALNALQVQFQFVSRPTTTFNVHCFALAAAPDSADYTYGSAAGEHPPITTYGSAARTLPDVTHAMVVGDTVGAEKVAATLQSECGRQLTAYLSRAYISTAADAAAAAQALIDKATQAAARAQIVAMPAFHLQPFDVISADDFSADTLRYLTEIREVYHPQRADLGEASALSGQLVWYQRLTLSQLLQDTSRGEGASSVIPQSYARSVIRKGSIISFDRTTWKAVVRVEGSISALNLYCAQWLQPTQLTAGNKCAVLMFDESNPTDALVIGTYGTTGWPYDLFPNYDAQGLLRRLVCGTTVNHQDVTDHWDNASSPGSAWSWAGAPFVTPATVVFNTLPSHMQVTSNGAGNRSFLKRTDGLTNTYTRLCQSLYSGNAGAYAGIRLDDGTDNNYIEVAVRYAAAYQYDWITVIRTGGGAVTTTSRKLIELPTTHILRMHVAGTLWSNWNAYGSIYPIYSSVRYQATIGTGLSWTPARKGIIIQHTGSTGDYFLFDWFQA